MPALSFASTESTSLRDRSCKRFKGHVSKSDLETVFIISSIIMIGGTVERQQWCVI